jgi:hypothetical protein
MLSCPSLRMPRRRCRPPPSRAVSRPLPSLRRRFPCPDARGGVCSPGLSPSSPLANNIHCKYVNKCTCFGKQTSCASDSSTIRSNHAVTSFTDFYGTNKANPKVVMSRHLGCPLSIPSHDAAMWRYVPKNSLVQQYDPTVVILQGFQKSVVELSTMSQSSH